MFAIVLIIYAYTMWYITYIIIVACVSSQVAYPWSLEVAGEETAQEEVPSVEGRSLRDLLHMSGGV